MFLCEEINGNKQCYQKEKARKRRREEKTFSMASIILYSLSTTIISNKNYFI